MCILFIAIDQHPDYPLVITANRDEFHGRPTEAMRFWPDRDNTLAGRDMLAGGTWFGVNRQGRIAAVTNFRTNGEHDVHARSRGELVAWFLENRDTVEQFCEIIRLRHERYNPFNLVFGDLEGLYCFSSMDPETRRLIPGFHSISNGPLDDSWPKMSRGVLALQQKLSAGNAIEPDELVTIMKDRTRANPDLLPDTGLDVQREVELSSIFIEGEEYGTRTTTILLANARHYDLYEHNFDKAGHDTVQQHFTLAVA